MNQIIFKYYYLILKNLRQSSYIFEIKKNPLQKLQFCRLHITIKYENHKYVWNIYRFCKVHFIN
jgi:hypothetical protein